MFPSWIERHIDSCVMTQKSRFTEKHQCNHRHVALLFRGHKLLAIGQNRIECRGPHYMIHAEADVLRSVHPSELRGATLVVFRIGSQSLLYSAPCPACSTLIEKCRRLYGLRRCVHS